MQSAAAEGSTEPAEQRLGVFARIIVKITKPFRKAEGAPQSTLEATEREVLVYYL